MLWDVFWWCLPEDGHLFSDFSCFLEVISRLFCFSSIRDRHYANTDESILAASRLSIELFHTYCCRRAAAAHISPRDAIAVYYFAFRHTLRLQPVAEMSCLLLLSSVTREFSCRRHIFADNRDADIFCHTILMLLRSRLLIYAITLHCLSFHWAALLWAFAFIWVAEDTPSPHYFLSRRHKRAPEILHWYRLRRRQMMLSPRRHIRYTFSAGLACLTYHFLHLLPADHAAAIRHFLRRELFFAINNRSFSASSQYAVTPMPHAYELSSRRFLFFEHYERLFHDYFHGYYHWMLGFPSFILFILFSLPRRHIEMIIADSAD